MSNNFSQIEKRIRIEWDNTRKLLINFFRRTNRAYGLKKWPEVKFSTEGGAYRVDLSQPIALKNWPYKASSSKKKCHILIDGHFTCSIDEADRIELLSYCTRIGYFALKKSEEPQFVESIDGYHFDMALDTQRAHPVFHAQRHEKVLTDKLDMVGLELYGNHPPSTLHHIHLPTPQLDIVSALIMVIADHIVCDVETEKGFFELAKKVRQRIPLKANLAKQANLNLCVDQQELLLDHWYAPVNS